MLVWNQCQLYDSLLYKHVGLRGMSWHCDNCAAAVTTPVACRAQETALTWAPSLTRTWETLRERTCWARRSSHTSTRTHTLSPLPCWCAKRDITTCNTTSPTWRPVTTSWRKVGGRVVLKQCGVCFVFLRTVFFMTDSTLVGVSCDVRNCRGTAFPTPVVCLFLVVNTLHPFLLLPFL